VSTSVAGFGTAAAVRSSAAVGAGGKEHRQRHHCEHAGASPASAHNALTSNAAGEFARFLCAATTPIVKA
jgi:hypothetical protein